MLVCRGIVYASAQVHCLHAGGRACTAMVARAGPFARGAACWPQAACLDGGCGRTLFLYMYSRLEQGLPCRMQPCGAINQPCVHRRCGHWHRAMGGRQARVRCDMGTHSCCVPVWHSLHGSSCRLCLKT